MTGSDLDDTIIKGTQVARGLRCEGVDIRKLELRKDMMSNRKTGISEGNMGGKLE